eukprot:s2327_g6.t6
MGVLSLPRDVAELKALCKQAPFGRGSETVVDRTIRRTMETQDVDVLWPDLKPVLSKVRAKLCPDVDLVAKLYKVLLYEPGDFFQPHVDSKVGDDHIMSLVVDCGAGACKGGQLCFPKRASQWRELEKIGRDRTWLSESGSWCCFFASELHCVEEVTSGCRVMATFNVFGSPAVPAAVPAQTGVAADSKTAFVTSSKQNCRVLSLPPQVQQRVVLTSGMGSVYCCSCTCSFHRDLLGGPSQILQLWLSEFKERLRAEMGDKALLGIPFHNMYSFDSSGILRPHHLRGRDSLCYKALVASGGHCRLLECAVSCETGGNIKGLSRARIGQDMTECVNFRPENYWSSPPATRPAIVVPERFQALAGAKTLSDEEMWFLNDTNGEIDWESPDNIVWPFRGVKWAVSRAYFAKRLLLESESCDRSGTLCGNAGQFRASAPETGLGQWPVAEVPAVPRPGSSPAGQWLEPAEVATAREPSESPSGQWPALPAEGGGSQSGQWPATSPQVATAREPVRPSESPSGQWPALPAEGGGSQSGQWPATSPQVPAQSGQWPATPTEVPVAAEPSFSSQGSPGQWPAPAQIKNLPNIIIPLVLKFNRFLDAELLQQSLAIALSLFPSIASRMRDRHCFVNCQAGVHFETVRRTEVVAHFKSAQEWASVDVFPKRVFVALADSPLLEARLSWFEGEGNLNGISVLSVAMNHAVGDMASLVTFLTAWSLLCDGGQVEALPADLVPPQPTTHRFTRLSEFSQKPSGGLTLEMLLAMAPELEKRRPRRIHSEAVAAEPEVTSIDAPEGVTCEALDIAGEGTFAPADLANKDEGCTPRQIVDGLSLHGAVNTVLELRVDMPSLKALKEELMCELAAENEWFSSFELLASMLFIAHAGIAEIPSSDKSGGILGAALNGFKSDASLVVPSGMLRILPVISVRGRVPGVAKNAFGNWSVYAKGVDVLTPVEKKDRIAAGHLTSALPTLDADAQRAVLLRAVHEFHAKLRQSVASLTDVLEGKEWVQLMADAGHGAELWRPSLLAEELAHLAKTNSAIVLNKYPTDPLIKLRFGSDEAVSGLLYSEDIHFRSENYWLIAHRGGEQGDLTITLALSPARADAFLKLIRAWSFPFEVTSVPEQSQSPSGQALSPAEVPAEPQRIRSQSGQWPATPTEVPAAAEPSFSSQVTTVPEQRPSPSGQALSPAEVPAKPQRSRSQSGQWPATPTEVAAAAEPSFSSQASPGQWPAPAQVATAPEQSQSPSGQALSPAEVPAQPQRSRSQSGQWPATPTEVPVAAEPSFSSQGSAGQWPAPAQVATVPEQSQSPSGQALSLAEAPAEPQRGGNQSGQWPDTPAEVPSSPEPSEHSESISSQWPAPGQVTANGSSSNALQWPPSVEASEQWPETAEASKPIRWPDAAVQEPAVSESSAPPMTKAPGDSAEVPVASPPAQAADSADVGAAVAAWPEQTQAMSSADPSSATMDWPSPMQVSDGAFGWPAAPLKAEAEVPSSWPPPTEVSASSAAKASGLTSSPADTQQPKVAVSLPLGSLSSGAKASEEPEELPSWWPKGS